MERINTECEALDLLTDGGLPVGTLTQLFGEKSVGKSLLSLQAAFNCAGKFGTAVIIDTEQSYNSYLLPYWKERFESRFSKKVNLAFPKINHELLQKRKQVPRSHIVSSIEKLLSDIGIKLSDSQISEITNIILNNITIDIEQKEDQIIILEVPELRDIFFLHGFDCTIEVSEGGRIELRLRRQPITPSPLEQLIEKVKAKIVVYDSISAPLKSVFSGTADLPARSTALSMVLNTAQRLCSKYSLSVLANSHLSVNPIQAWERHPFGGAIIGYEAKFSFEITKVNAKRNENAECVNQDKKDRASRTIWVQRHPAVEEYSKYGFCIINEYGLQ